MPRWMPILVVAVAALQGCALRHQTTALDYSAEPLPVARIGEDDIRYDVQGPQDAEAVVMIHGFGSSLHSWDPVTPALVDRFRVVRLDLKGFGQSSKYEGDYSPEAQARIVLQLMDELGIDRAHFVAHSMGCLVALVVALEAPDRVDRLVLTGAWVYAEQLPWSLRSAETAGMGELIFGLWYAENLEWRFELSFHEPDRWITEDVLLRARSTLSQPGARAAALATVRALDLPDHELRYDEVEAPTLVVYGQEDRVARPEFGERLVGQLPRARLEVFPHCGHFPMIEYAERYTRLVRRWLEGGR